MLCSTVFVKGEKGKIYLFSYTRDNNLRIVALR